MYKVSFLPIIALIIFFATTLVILDIENALPISHGLAKGIKRKDQKKIGTFEIETQIYVVKKEKKIVISLPDNGVPLNPELIGVAWKLANASQIQSKRQNMNVARPSNAALSPLKKTLICQGLCGRHGWGECKNATCYCPVLFSTPNCLVHNIINNIKLNLLRNPSLFSALSWPDSYQCSKE